MNLNPFRTITLAERIDAELDQARHELLDTLSVRERADAAVTALNARIRRLEAEKAKQPGKEV